MSLTLVRANSDTFPWPSEVYLKEAIVLGDPPVVMLSFEILSIEL